MAVTPTLITVTVTTAGTQVQVTTDTDIRPAWIKFEALGSNTGQIYIGNLDVSSTVYFNRLPIPTTALVTEVEYRSGSNGNGRSGATGFQLSNFWIDSSVNGEKVQVTYGYETGG
jgi:hypothetical protein